MLRFRLLSLCCVASLATASWAQPGQPPETPVVPVPTSPAGPERQSKEPRPSSLKFDESADARKQIAAAMKPAGRENRRILIVWGDNLSGWSKSLLSTLDQDPKIKELLRNEYDLVLVEAGRNNKNIDLAAMYKVDIITGGLPFLTILDPAGTVIANQETGVFEMKMPGEHKVHDGGKLRKFLESHKAPSLAAESVVLAARTAAKAQGKNVFLHFGAPWCGWCKKLDAWLEREDVAPYLSKDLICVKVDVDRMEGGKSVFAKYDSKAGKSGIPWFVILSGESGAAVTTSDAPAGNIGFPSTDEEIAHFVTMLKAGAKNVTDSDLEHLKTTLVEGRKK